MLDARMIGAYISKLRKEADMTQVELADRLHVSHQAVSKWERGESLPDIGTLVELAKVFQQTIDQILYGGKNKNHGKPVDPLIKKMAERPETAGEAVNAGEATVDELVDVAPLLKTSVLQKVTEKIDKKLFTLDHVIQLAPFLDEQALDELLAAVKVEEADWKIIGSLAPFTNPETLASLIHTTVHEPPTLKEVIRLAPFLGNYTDAFLHEAKSEEATWGDLVALASFVKRHTLKKFIEDHPEIVPTIKDLAAVAPFLNHDTNPLVQQALDRGGEVAWEDIRSLAPFIDSESLAALLDRLNEAVEFQQLVELAPFLGQDHDEYFLRAAKNGMTWDDIKNGAPFVQRRTLSILIDGMADGPTNARQIADLAPFLESEKLSELLADIPSDQIDPEAITALAPFMKKSRFSEFMAKLLKKHNALP